MTYDTGFVRDGGISRERFDPQVVRRELAIIRDDLHCNAVQLIGGDPERLELAAGYAHELGLEIWFSPYPLELGPGEILSLFADCAERPERVRTRGAEVVFVAGVELSIMNRAFMPGASVDDRLGWLLDDPGRRRERLAGVSARVNDFLALALALALAAVRERFRAAGSPTPRYRSSRSTGHPSTSCQSSSSGPPRSPASSGGCPPPRRGREAGGDHRVRHGCLPRRGRQRQSRHGRSRI
jgi:hypothetical protein